MYFSMKTRSLVESGLLLCGLVGIGQPIKQHRDGKLGGVAAIRP
jgi:hypothetical protein